MKNHWTKEEVIHKSKFNRTNVKNILQASKKIQLDLSGGSLPPSGTLKDKAKDLSLKFNELAENLSMNKTFPWIITSPEILTFLSFGMDYTPDMRAVYGELKPVRVELEKVTKVGTISKNDETWHVFVDNLFPVNRILFGKSVIPEGAVNLYLNVL